MKQDVSNELLGAFVDKELACSDNRTIAEELKTNPEMAARAQAMLDLKTAIKQAYPEPAAKTGRSNESKTTGKLLKQSIAASFILGLGLLLGSVINQHSVEDSLFGITLQPVAQHSDKVLLHVSTADIDRLDFLLTKTERMLRDSHNSNHEMSIEVIANSDGINLLRKATTPYEERIQQLQQRYANLQFIACANTVKRLKKSGKNVQMLDGVKADVPALDTIVKRMDKGWTYVKI